MTRLLLWAACVAPTILIAPVASAQSLDMVGSYDPGSPGLNASVVGLDGFAYLGSWGSAANRLGRVARILDGSDPTAPTLLGSAAVYPGTTAEPLAVVHYAASAFSGSVLFV